MAALQHLVITCLILKTIFHQHNLQKILDNGNNQDKYISISKVFTAEINNKCDYILISENMFSRANYNYNYQKETSALWLSILERFAIK